MEYRMDPNRQPRFIIRSCFGGSNAAFVASGSEARLSASQPHTSSPFLMQALHILRCHGRIEALWDNASPVGVQCCSGRGCLQGLSGCTPGT